MDRACQGMKLSRRKRRSVLPEGQIICWNVDHPLSHGKVDCSEPTRLSGGKLVGRSIEVEIGTMQVVTVECGNM